MMPTDFNWTIRVYYEDTDAGGVVFYANYLKFFERARTEWLRAKGFSQHALIKSHGIFFVVKSVQADYHAPAKLDDELKLTVVVERWGLASLQFIQQAWRVTGNEPVLLASSRIKVACVGSADFRPTSIPNDIRLKMQDTN